MALSEQERTWLKRRKNLCSRCEWNLYDNPCIQYGRRGESGECPGFRYRVVEGLDEGDIEFEARVAASPLISRLCRTVAEPLAGVHILREARKRRRRSVPYVRDERDAPRRGS